MININSLLLFSIFNGCKKPIFGILIGFGIFVGLVSFRIYELSNEQNNVASPIITADIKLYAVIGIAIIAGILYVFEKIKFIKMEHVWGLLTLFTITIIPLTAVPSVLEYWNVSQYWFFIAMFIVILSWVLLGKIFRKSESSDITYYDRLLYVLPLYFLMMGGIIFWLVQSI